MNFPAGFDPLAVTKLALNGSYFHVDDEDEAFRRAGELFPSARMVKMLFPENPGWCVVEILPKPELSKEEYKQLTDLIEDVLPQGPFRGAPFEVPWDMRDDDDESTESGGSEPESWSPRDPEAWRKADD